MIPLLVLIGAFFIIAFASRFTRMADSARIAMAIMLCFTGVSHFAYTEGMVTMIPDPVPFKKLAVYITGVIEVIFALVLFSGRHKILAGWMLIAFFIATLPANIQASILHVDYKTASFNGPGPNYLWFRIPLQLFFITWVYTSCIRTGRTPVARINDEK